MPDAALRILVKAAPTTIGKGFRLAGAPVSFTPLFKSIRAPRSGRLTATALPTWHIASAPVGTLNPWDACHDMVRQGLSLTGGGVTFAEPDLEQEWLWADSNRMMLGLTSGCGPGAPQKSGSYPTNNDNYWHLDNSFSQLTDAQAMVRPGARPVRIAHLDTGYDANHHSKPAHLRTDLQKNFADEDRPNDATDQPTGVINPMFGHGTGTLSLLAGRVGNRLLGGACDMEIVPVRVANWVVLFRNSAIAQAFDYVHGLCANPETHIDVVTMSMGGLASAAWADAVNALYEAGVFVVTAAGNNFGNLPTRYIVYPARFNRVTAACGVMSDGRPYADLPISYMAGNYGPAGKMQTAITAYTPNVPWAKYGCPDTVDFDGGGTSAATPQVAAAAALWIQKNQAALDRLPADKAWQKVEAVRRALFSRADKKPDGTHLGNGLIKAKDALGAGIASNLTLTAPDNASFALLRGLLGLGVTAAAPGDRQKMLELEALQLSQRSREIETLLAGASPDDTELLQTRGRARPILEALADHPGASAALKREIAGALRGGPPAPAGGAPATPAKRGKAQAPPQAPEIRPPAPVPTLRSLPVSDPPSRRLKVFAFDPSLRTRLETLSLNQAILDVQWESDLKPGPVGEYLEVVDVDPPSGLVYPPVDLNTPALLAQDGLAPTEGDPRFHQQTVYAVAMKTIQHFERALGRVAQWADREAVVDGQFGFRFVQRLRIYPHGLAEANAYYSPDRHALLFGYFPASRSNAGDNLPGGLIFSCLSHDIVAHETTHALLDGLHPFFRDYTSSEMLAFHEAFADIVALFQHFTLPDALHDQIRKSRGDLTIAQLLGGLALQFGQAIGNRGVLRSAIARFDTDTQTWVPIKPKPTDFDTSLEPHALGAVLVAAVFDAFLQIYAREADELRRLASSGTGVLPEGELPHDLIEHLAKAAAKIAARVLQICIRALDYCPPVDINFGDYLRALVTADRELVPDDDGAYRVAFISAFRARGIYPASVRNLSDEGLCWEKPHDLDIGGLAKAIGKLAPSWRITSDRYQAFVSANECARELYHTMLNTMDPAMAEARLGLILKGGSVTIDGQKGTVTKPRLTVRPSRRVRPDGEVVTSAMIEITQKWTGGGSTLRGGCTIIVSLEDSKVQYLIGKRLRDPRRLAAQAEAIKGLQTGSAFTNYYGTSSRPDEPFALMHRY